MSTVAVPLDRFGPGCYCESMEERVQYVRRIGILGDVHTEDSGLEAALTFLHSFPGLDALFCTGDVVTGTGDAGRYCQLLRENNVLTVRGNHDRWFFGEAYEQLLQTTPADEITGAARSCSVTGPTPTTWIRCTPRTVKSSFPQTTACIASSQRGIIILCSAVTPISTWFALSAI